MTYPKVYRIALSLALAVAGASFSASNGLAFSSEAQQMCTGDALRLCGSEIPNISRITACMVRHRAQVSPGCRAVMDREAAARRSARTASY